MLSARIIICKSAGAPRLPSRMVLRRCPADNLVARTVCGCTGSATYDNQFLASRIRRIRPHRVELPRKENSPKYFSSSAGPNPNKKATRKDVASQKIIASDSDFQSMRHLRHSSATDRPTKKNTQRRTSKARKRQNPWLLPECHEEALEKETIRVLEQCQEQQQAPGVGGTVDNINTDAIKQQCLDIMEAWVLHAEKNQDVKAAERAETLLKTLEDNLKIIPRLECYDSVVRAYASCSEFGKDGSDKAAERADQVLRHAIQYTPHTVSVRTYTPVYKAWGNSGSPNAGERAASLRNLMISKTGDRSWDMESIRAEMNAWSRSGHPKAPERILQLLLTTIQIWTDAQSQKTTTKGSSHEDPERVSVAPTEEMFHTAMGALSKSATRHNQRSVRQVAQQLDSIAQLMMERQHEWQISPTLRTFMIVLGAWERVERVEKKGDAAQRAQSLLEYMIESAVNKKQHGQSSVLSNNNPKKRKRIMPTNTSFASVMVAWCDAEQPDRAEHLYHRLVKLHQSTKDNMLLPTTYVATTLLAGWASLGRPDRVMEIMRMMQRVALDTKHPACQLDLRTFNTLLNALGKARQPNDALALLEWLENPKEKFAVHQQSEKIKDKYAAFFNPLTIGGLEPPNNVTYGCVLEVLVKSGMMRNAEAILSSMQEKGIRPNQVAYTSVIHGYSLMGHDPNNVARAHKIFQEVIATQKADVVCSTAFINVCSGAQPVERHLALDLALEVYEALGERERNEMTYKAMAVTIQRLVVWHETDASTTNTSWSTPAEAEAEQIRMLQKLAKECCEAGFLSLSVATTLEQMAGSRQLAYKMMGQDHHLHPSWSRKIQPSDRPSRE